jgi:hypothetical protein
MGTEIWVWWAPLQRAVEEYTGSLPVQKGVGLKMANLLSN